MLLTLAIVLSLYAVDHLHVAGRSVTSTSGAISFGVFFVLSNSLFERKIAINSMATTTHFFLLGTWFFETFPQCDRRRMVGKG